MSELSKNQIILIGDLKEDIDFYTEELDSQIKSHRIMLFSAIALAIIVGVCLVMFPSLLNSLKEQFDHFGTLAGFATETIPITFASKSFNKGNIIKKKKKGLRIFEKDINRMEQGILPNQKENILSLEQELMRYINT